MKLEFALADQQFQQVELKEVTYLKNRHRKVTASAVFRSSCGRCSLKESRCKARIAG